MQKSEYCELSPDGRVVFRTGGLEAVPPSPPGGTGGTANPMALAVAELGLDGWELVSVLPDPGAQGRDRWIFKRPIAG